MKVYLEVLDNWIDVESPTLWVSASIRDLATHAIKEAVVEQLISRTELPNITIPEEEIRAALKERVVDQLAAKALGNL